MLGGWTWVASQERGVGKVEREAVDGECILQFRIHESVSPWMRRSGEAAGNAQEMVMFSSESV
jgi:hypothetical protein